MPVHFQNLDRGAAPPRVVRLRLALPLACAMALTLATPLAAQAAEGLREVRDPVTGEMRGPTAAEIAAFRQAEAQLRAQNPQAAVNAVKGPVEIIHPDGSVETKLDEDTMMYSVVRANADGSLAMACLPGKQAKAFVHSAKAATGAKAKAKVVTQAKAGHHHE